MAEPVIDPSYSLQNLHHHPQHDNETEEFDEYNNDFLKTGLEKEKSPVDIVIGNGNDEEDEEEMVKARDDSP
jgi:hypothetical protein